MSRQVQSHQLKFSNGAATATTNLSTESVNLWGAYNSVQVVLTGSGTVSVTATVQVSNDRSNWIDATALSLSGTGGDTDGATLASGWMWMRVTLSSITGTSATASVFHAGYGL
jgi:hypothetical protein